VTARTVNLLTVASLMGLLGALTLTAPRWARLMRQPVSALPDDDPASAPAATAASPEPDAERTISVKLYFESPDLFGLLPEDRSLPFSVELSRQLRARLAASEAERRL